MEAIDVYTGEVVEVPFFSQRYVPAKMKYEKEDHHSMTEQAYVPPQVQIADMMLAGIRLADERRQRFDSSDLQIPEGEDIPLDPLREPGIDLVDVQKTVAAVSARLADSQEKANREAQEARDAAYKAELEKSVQAELELRGKAVK